MFVSTEESRESLWIAYGFIHESESAKNLVSIDFTFFRQIKRGRFRSWKFTSIYISTYPDEVGSVFLAVLCGIHYRTPGLDWTLTKEHFTNAFHKLFQRFSIFGFFSVLAGFSLDSEKQNFQLFTLAPFRWNEKNNKPLFTANTHD